MIKKQQGLNDNNKLCFMLVAVPLKKLLLLVNRTAKRRYDGNVRFFSFWQKTALLILMILFPRTAMQMFTNSAKKVLYFNLVHLLKSEFLGATFTVLRRWTQLNSHFLFVENFCQYHSVCVRRGGLMVELWVLRTGFKPWACLLCCILWQDTLLSQCVPT